MHTWRLMAIPIPWLVTNLTMYSTPPTCAVAFGNGQCEELAKLGPLTEFHTQLISLEAWQVPRLHQKTYNRSYYSVIFQL